MSLRIARDALSLFTFDLSPICFKAADLSFNSDLI